MVCFPWNIQYLPYMFLCTGINQCHCTILWKCVWRCFSIFRHLPQCAILTFKNKNQLINIDLYHSFNNNRMKKVNLSYSFYNHNNNTNVKRKVKVTTFESFNLFLKYSTRKQITSHFLSPNFYMKWFY